MADRREQELRTALLGELERLGAGLDPLRRVEDIPRLEAFIDDVGAALIADARATGATWADIAERLGVSRQAAHKRFSNGRRTRRGRVIELRFERPEK